MHCVENIIDLRNLKKTFLRERALPKGVLMCRPDHFEVMDEKNYFMRGQQGKVNRNRALRQWMNLKDKFQSCGLMVNVIEPAVGVEDMVFSANSALCWQEPGQQKKCIVSKMFHPSRQRETPYYQDWFTKHGYEVFELNSEKLAFFEGGGDAIWQPGKMLLWGGYGHRSSSEVYTNISKIINAPVILLKLASEEFYHLDTCFCPLDEKTVLYCPEAFDADGRALIESFFDDKVIITKEQGKKFFTGNCFSVDGKNVVLQQGDHPTVEKLISLNFNPIEVDLSEYIKSGGNVTCLKLDIY